MPRVLLLSRQPLSKRPLQEWLEGTAGQVVLLTTPKAVTGAQDVLAEYFPDHHLVDDYNSWGAEHAAELAARRFGVGGIASTSEHDVLRAARLRERLGLPGQSVASATAYRDKVVMKETLRAAGIGVPEFTAVDSPGDLLAFTERHGFPVVVKPRFGAGADGVSIVRDAKDVEAFWAGERQASPPFLPGQWMAETFVAGDFFHVDGIMRAGRTVHCWPSQYNGGIAEHVRDATVLSSVLLPGGDERLEVLRELTAAVITALPAAPHPLAFHLEAWIDPRGRTVVCEIASRAGGGLIAETYERAFGVQLAREGLRAQCGSDLRLSGQPDAPGEAHGWTLLPPGHGTFTPPGEPCPVPGVELELRMKAGAVGDGLSLAGQAAAGALVTGRTPQEVRDRVADLARWWRLNTSWE